MTEHEFIDPKHLRPGPIRHESLSPEILEQAQAVHEVIGHYLGTTLEQFEVNLMRDADPASEMIVWCSVTAAWLSYHERHLAGKVQSDEQEKKLLGILVAISTGNDDIRTFGVPEVVGRRLLQCYDDLGKAADDE
jgi:hypothetical protein